MNCSTLWIINNAILHTSTKHGQCQGKKSIEMNYCPRPATALGPVSSSTSLGSSTAEQPHAVWSNFDCVPWNTCTSCPQQPGPAPTLITTTMIMMIIFTYIIPILFYSYTGYSRTLASPSTSPIHCWPL